MSSVPKISLLIKTAADSLGFSVQLEPQFGHFGQINLSGGKRVYFKKNIIDVNFMGAGALVDDKEFSSYFLKKMGYKTVEGKSFFSDEWCKTNRLDRDKRKAIDYARSLTFPVVVKPNSGSCGRGVFVVDNIVELDEALEILFKTERVVLVQRYIGLSDYRIVVFNSKIYMAYQRIPLAIIGDGISSIKDLLDKKLKYLHSRQRDILISIDDPRISMSLKRAGLLADSVLPKGETLSLLHNANLSSGGEAVDITGGVGETVCEYVIKAVNDMGLRLAGVDLLADDISGDFSDGIYILELNHSPGLEHYSTISSTAEERTVTLYRDILKYLSGAVS